MNTNTYTQARSRVAYSLCADTHVWARPGAKNRQASMATMKATRVPSWRTSPRIAPVTTATIIRIAMIMSIAISLLCVITPGGCSFDSFSHCYQTVVEAFVGKNAVGRFRIAGEGGLYGFVLFAAQECAVGGNHIVVD